MYSVSIIISTAITPVVSWRTAVINTISQVNLTIVSSRVIREFRTIHSLVALLLASEAEALSKDALFFFEPAHVWATVSSILTSHSVVTVRCVTIPRSSLEILATSVRLTTWSETVSVVVAISISIVISWILVPVTSSITWALSIPTTII